MLRQQHAFNDRAYVWTSFVKLEQVTTCRHEVDNCQLQEHLNFMQKLT